MKMSRILTAIALFLVLVMAFTSCGQKQPDTTTAQPQGSTTAPVSGTDPTPDHVCESKCPTCNLCLDATCDEDVCVNKCQGGHPTTPTDTTPVITVDPAYLEINAGDDIDLMFDVTVKDEGDPDARVFIEDDDGFVNTVVGEYTITYKAVNKYDNTATATRTVKVNQALPALVLETKANRLGEDKWQGTMINFRNKEYHALTESTTVAKQSGVFHNTSSEAITLTVSGSDYAVVAILTANGVVIEGRDGANNRLVNVANPIRANSTVSVNVDSIAEEMVIPAGGFAVVVQTGYCGDTVDSDGRGFMNYNVIYAYGNVVRLYFADKPDAPLTTYVNQAPVISGNGTKLYASLGQVTDLATFILNGVKATDDNGTFEASDDVTVDVTVKYDGGFNADVAGTYTITLEATDGTLTATATRVVEVTDQMVEITVGANSYSTLPGFIAVDMDIAKLGSYLFVVYTPDYTGVLNWTNGWGIAFILDEYGNIIRIYDGMNAKYWDAENTGGITDSTKCTDKGYLTEAFVSRQAGEYMIVAPNGAASRDFFFQNRTIGAKVTIPGVTFKHECESECVQCGKCTDQLCEDAACATKCEGHEHNCADICDVCKKCTSECTDEVCASKCDCVTVVVGEKSLKIAAGTIAIDVAAPTVGSYNFIVYTYAFKAENETLSWGNGWSQAFILNQYGQVVRVYDGVSGGKYFDAANRAGVTGVTAAGSTLTDAYASLSEGETLILGANGGLNNAGRGFLGGVRKIGLIATIPGVTFEALPEHSCESACSKCGKCTDATCIMPDCLDQCVCHFCESKCETCGGCLDTACTEEDCAVKCSCHSCESHCDTCGGCKNSECNDAVCATKCVCTLTPETGKYLAINGTYFYASTYFYNEDLTKSTCGSRQLIIFDKTYTGEITVDSLNGYGVALVFDANGVFVKAYTWEGIYKYGSEKSTIDYVQTDGSYAVKAWNELENGETLVIFANGATTSDARKYWAWPLCSSALGKTAVLTGYTFGQTVTHSCESVCATCGNCTNAECKEAACATKCEGHDVVAHTCTSVCQYCNNCINADCAETACASKCAGHLVFSVEDKTYAAAYGKYSYNAAVRGSANESGTAPYAHTFEMIVFEYGYTGGFNTNANGVALVFDADGQLVKGYVGFGNYYDSTGSHDKTDHFTAATYATVAFSELEEGETVVIFPNITGSLATDPHRSFANSICSNWSSYYGKTVTLTKTSSATSN